MNWVKIYGPEIDVSKQNHGVSLQIAGGVQRIRGFGGIARRCRLNK